MSIRAICWDFGGVIVRTFDRSDRERWERRLGLAPYDLERLVFNGEMGIRASIGKATTEDVFRSVGERFSLSAPDSDALARDFFAGDRADEDLIRLIRSLRPTYKTGLISNAWPELRGWISDLWGFADAFDHMSISAELGLMKPEPPIYHHALHALGVAPEQTVFLDDFEENVLAARALGMHAIRFRKPDQATWDLQMLLAAQA
jgi:epoxide hydrolase-like predicted phosphatase